MTGSSTRYGSDVIVDLMIEAEIEHVAFNPGASFRGIHDSLVHTDRAAHVVLCMHEAVSVAVAQGYAKAAGKPMAVLLHDVVGLQNASMAIYNAWCDRTPMLLIGGTGPKSKARRRPWIDWIHTATVQAEQVRNYVKWDDEPHDMASVPESFARAYTTTCAEPAGPVYLCYDVELQEDTLPDDYVAEPLAGYAMPTAPAASDRDLDELAAALREAERPAIIAGYTTGTAALGELADLLGAPVVDKGMRLALPTSHPLNASGVEGLLEEADVVLALDVDELRGPLGTAPSCTLLNVSLGHLRLRGWAHDYGPLQPAGIHVTASADSVVPALVERLRAQTPPDAGEITRPHRRGARGLARCGVQRRGGRLYPARAPRVRARAGAGRRALRARQRHQPALRAPAVGHVGSPASTSAGMRAAVLATASARPSAPRLRSAGTGSASSVQADGDLLYLPSALWTAAQLSAPQLIVVHNNRQYGNTVEHAAAIATQRGRAAERRYVGAGLAEPAVTSPTLAKSFGVWATGPVDRPATLTDGLAEAVAVVRSGRPALVDVLTPGS